MRSIVLYGTGKLVRLADVVNNTIVKIEAGKNKNSTLDTLQKIARALDLSIEVDKMIVAKSVVGEVNYK